MYSAKSCLVIGLALLLQILLPAQDIQITYQNSDSLFVCGTDTFFIQIQHQFSNPVADAVVQVNLPVGLQYVAGSAEGATELNINNLSAPSFAMPVLAPQQNHPFFIQITATCDAADLIDAGQLFQALISFTSTSGNAQVATASIPVETGALVIESISPSILSGEKGDTLYRTICFKNTRLGKIGNLHFQDAHQDGFEVFVEGADAFIADSGLVKATFSATLFQSVGNGDLWLDQDEKVCITERIIIKDCGTPPASQFSLLRAGWGCDVNWCRYDSIIVQLDIKTSTNVPELHFTPIWSPPKDYCGEIPAIMGYHIRNIGKADATNVVFNVQLTEAIGEAGMVPGSFKIVTAAGAQVITPNISSSGYLQACEKTPFQSANFLIPLVPALDSIEFIFEVITCVDPCNQVQPAFKADFFYQKACPPNGFSSGNVKIIPEEGYIVGADFYSSIGECMVIDVAYPFSYRATGKYLLEDGFWHIKLHLPQSVVFDTTCGSLLGNQAPALFEENFDSTGRQLVHLAWKTPLDNDTLSLNYCLRVLCDSLKLKCEPTTQQQGVYYLDPCCYQDLFDTTYWSIALQTPTECGISACGGRPIGVRNICVDGGGSGVILGNFTPLTEMPGLKIGSNTYRKNVGFKDAEDDRKADLPLTKATGNWRKDRFLPGDTIHVDLWGTIDTLLQHDTLVYTVLHQITSNDMGVNDNDIFVTETARYGFMGSDKIVLTGTTLRIKYANGQEASCDFNDQWITGENQFFRIEQPNVFPPQAINEVASISFSYLIPLPVLMDQGCIPKPYLEIGDSVFITKEYKINTNFKPASSNAPDPPLIGFRTTALFGGGTFAGDSLPHFKLQYSGWNLSRTVNQHTIKPCESSIEPKKFSYSMRIARENMFPFEVRPLAWINDYGQTKPEGLELLSAKLEYLNLQHNTPWLSNLSLPFNQSPLNLQVDFSPVFAEPIDEGFSLGTQLTFKPDCLFSLPDSSIQFLQTTFNGCLNADTMVWFDTLRNPIGFFANTPRLSITTNDSVVNSPTRSFDIDFAIKNALVSPAPYAWVYLDAPSGLVNQLELIQLPQNQPISGNSGFFGLQQFNGLTTKNFRIKGENLSCDLDSLYIYFGWTCHPIQQISDASCGIDTMLILLNLERPELELDIIQEPDQILLCEESDWFEFEVYNAKFGYTYELLSTLKFPSGLQIAPGSCQISYPEGSQWVDIPSPLETGSGFYEWQVSDLLPLVAANGLPGFNQAPQNSYRIRFKVLAECGFVANTPIIYGATGTEPCGRQANVLNKQGQPLQINGLSTPYGVLINLQPVGNLANTCGDFQEIQVNLQLLGTPSTTDSVYITLPQDLLLVSNSYLPGQNAPSGPVTPNEQGFQLPLPLLQGGGLVSFRFKVQYFGLTGCADKTLQAQTRVRTEAFCPSLGAPCVVYQATGEGAFILDIKRPLLVITDASFTLNSGTIIGAITLTNTGDISAGQATVHFWRDVNGDGLADANDLLVSSLNTFAPIAPGESVVLSGIIPNLDSTEWCDLLIQLPADLNCLCNDQLLQPEQWQVDHTDLHFCSLSPVTIGVPEQAGHSYGWLSDPGLACANCATTTYTPAAGTPVNTPVELVLMEQSDNCTIRHNFQLSFSSSATIAASDPEICRGQSVTLSAQPETGVAYLWAGQGIINPNQATQLVQPSGSSIYTVVVTFANGCTASQSIEILVLAPDTVLLAELTTCPGVPVSVLGNITETPGTYQLLLTNSQGCDSLVLQSLALIPPVQTTENFTFCLGDTLKNVLDTFFTGSGQVCRTFQGLNGCDSVHCAIVTAVEPPEFPVQDTLFVDFGQVITLSGPVGFDTYWWTPEPTPPCDDCKEVTYTTDSITYQEYRLQVTDANGCGGELIFRVLVLPPCSPDRLYIPNAFTPNGDGSNDVFRVVPYEGSEVVSSLEIYNRWGQKVYENRGSAYWDGTIDGQPASSDVYVYILTVQCGNLTGKRVGDVTLLR